MFNVRIKRFLTTEQIQIYSSPVKSKNSEREDRFKLYNPSTGEIVPPNRKLFVNPFDDEFVIGCNIGNAELNLQRSVRRTKNAIYDISRSNEWDWFVTLTFNKDKVDRYDYEECTKKLSRWFDTIRRKCPHMKYLVVPELHKDGAYHFHGLFANVGDLTFVDSGKRDAGNRIIYNVGEYRLGFVTATQVDNLEHACSYISKYTTKDLCTVTYNKKRYWHSKNCSVPNVEEYFCYMSEEEIRACCEEQYIKKVYSEYADVTYIEAPIYTTNTSRFVTNENYGSIHSDLE